MINGLAAWHYPHRSPLENVRFFAERGFDAVSLTGKGMAKICVDDAAARELASIILEKGIVFTVHGKLPLSHDAGDVEEFKRSVDCIAKWQKEYGLISILSFDVYPAVRNNVIPYVEYVLNYPQFKKVALEDFGFKESDRSQLQSLKANDRFGYLVDVGHMNIRLTRAKNGSGATLTYEDFLAEFKSLDFPIFEIHLHNNDGVSDLHNFLEDGTLDVGMVARLLKEIRYSGILTIESAPGYAFECKYPESDRRILKTLEFWKKFLSHAE